MTDKKTSYLEKQLEATLNFEQNQVVVTFQREKIKLANDLEITLLQENNPFIEKNITFTEDELIFTYKKEPHFITFGKLRTLDDKSRWMFASHVLRFIMLHKSSRLHLIVCPENILIDESLKAYFLHYGVKESLPPYERNPEQLWEETKALIAAAVQPKYKFDQYIQFSKSIELSTIAAKIMDANDEQELLAIIQTELQLLDSEEKKYTKIARTKWNWVRYSLIGLLFVLLPLGIYTGYAAFVLQPQQKAYVAVQGPYIQGNYSEIIDQLAQYDVEKMPDVIQYELSLAYIVNETLTEEQKENVLKTITLQTDPDYFKYWIYIGRGQAEEALTVARQLEDLDLIMLALLHYEESIKADRELDSEEREQLLDKVQKEIDEATKQLEELKKALESEAATADETSAANGADSSSKQAQDKAEVKTTAPEKTDDAKGEKPAQPEKTTEAGVE